MAISEAIFSLKKYTVGIFQVTFLIQTFLKFRCASVAFTGVAGVTSLIQKMKSVSVTIFNRFKKNLKSVSAIGV